jgi:hypothetical protein
MFEGGANEAEKHSLNVLLRLSLAADQKKMTPCGAILYSTRHASVAAVMARLDDHHPVAVIPPAMPAAVTMHLGARAVALVIATAMVIATAFDYDGLGTRN